MDLTRILADAPARPDDVAIEESAGGSIRYGELAHLVDAIALGLRDRGLRPGDRVAFALPKSIDAVALTLATIRSGAAYVPVDPRSPADRAASILSDADPGVVVLDAPNAEALAGRLPDRPVIRLETTGGGTGWQPWLGSGELEVPATAPDDVAYLLFTSGSTGRPKGVVLTHRNASSFLDWAADTFRPERGERFASHAPLHFDLSILDVFLSLGTGSTLVLLDDDLGRDARRLGAFLGESRITSWYSTPSILALLVEHGRLEDHPVPTLERVLFAGEVFPLPPLRRLRTAWPHPEMWNLYGPTETNVCTAHRLPASIEEERGEPFPIGRPCRHAETRIVGPDGNPVADGEVGELLVAGDPVTPGYWRRPDLDEGAFLEVGGKRWYRTGDLVEEDSEGVLQFRGRRDRMVKHRGHRVELGEVEAALYRHPDIEEAAVMASQAEDGSSLLTAFVAPRNGDRLPTLALRAYCRDHLPAAMVPDRFEFLPRLPRTSTQKVDYPTLEGRV